VKAREVNHAPTTEQFEDAERQALGERLRSLRMTNALSRRQVGESVGLSVSFLRMVERGETDMSLARFTRLATFYGVSVSELLAEAEPLVTPDIGVIGAFPRVDRGEGVDYRILRHVPPQIVAVTIAPSARFSDLRAHRGEDIWIVTEGTPVLMYGGKNYPVRSGDVVNISGAVEHGVANPSDLPASLIAICSVPYW
jgi:transcriptional regulator with XRE-family HTH domain